MLFVEIEPLPPRTCDAPVPHDHMLSPRTCDALVPHDHRLPPGGGTPSSHTITATALRALRNKWPEGGPSPCSPQGGGTPSSHTITATALRAPRNKWPEGGPSPCFPKEVGRPRPTRSQPPRPARYETNGPRAGHLPAPPRRWDALVPHDHNHRAPLAAKFSLRPRDFVLFSTPKIYRSAAILTKNGSYPNANHHHLDLHACHATQN